MADEGPLLVTDALTKLFDRARAVDNVSLDIPAGQFVGVIGRSGAGKSTLLRLINRLTEPSAGRVLCDGIEVTVLRGPRLRVGRRRCAMIFQQFNLVGRLDVLNNVLMGRLAYAPAWHSLPKLWSRDDKIMAMAALDQFGLAGPRGEPRTFRAVSSSGWRFAAPCCRSPKSCWPTSRWLRSILRRSEEHTSELQSRPHLVCR